MCSLRKKVLALVGVLAVAGCSTLPFYGPANKAPACEVRCGSGLCCPTGWTCASGGMCKQPDGDWP